MLRLTISVLWSLILCLLAAIATAGEENFSSLDEKKWDIRLTGPGSAVQLLKNEVALIHRPYLLSKEEWSGKRELSFEWMPSESVKADDGRTYGDHLLVLLSTTGGSRHERSYEPEDGIVIRFDSVSGLVQIQIAKSGGKEFETLAKVEAPAGVDPAKWHSVKIRDTMDSIVVEIDGRVTTAERVPALDARKGKRWGFSNREPVGPGSKVSRLKSVVWKEIQ